MEDYQPRVLSASTLMGDDVRNLEGEDLGKIKEIMLDLNTGQIAYAVLSFGGVLGVGDRLFAVPWEALRVDTNEKAFILDVDKEVLENAPGFAKDRWPGTADRTFIDQVHAHYGYEPYYVGHRS